MFMHIHENIVKGPTGNTGKTKPLCRTGWLCHWSQIKQILNRYELIIKTLTELTEKDVAELVVYLAYLRMDLHILA